MKAYQLFFVSGLFTGLTVMACSSGDDSNGDAGDAMTGGDTKPQKDASPLDMGLEEMPAIVTPAGKQLAPGNSIQIVGISSDNHVIYFDNGLGGAWAVPADGSTAPVLISMTASEVGIAGKVVFVLTGSTSTNPVGALSLWQSGSTLKAVATATKSSLSAGFAATTDGTKVIFSQACNTTGTIGDFVGAASDGTGVHSLATQVDIVASSGTTDASCTPIPGFAGGVNPVLAFCASAPADGGTAAATVNAYDATTWASTNLVMNARNFWASDTAGDKIMVSSAAGVQTCTVAGVCTAIDATKQIGHNDFGYMKKDGNHVVYQTPAGDLWESPVSSPVPLELVTTGVKVVRAVSPDEGYVLYHTMTDSKNFGSDIYMASTTAAQTTTLVSTTLGALFGLSPNADNFTTDSKFVLFINNVDNSSFIGDLYYQSVTGSTATKITTLEWLNLSATGEKIVYNDNCQGCGENTNMQVIGIADIKSIDLSASTPTPGLIQANADPQIYMAIPKDRVIYTYSQNAPSDDGGTTANGNGLWSAPIP